MTSIMAIFYVFFWYTIGLVFNSSEQMSSNHLRGNVNFYREIIRHEINFFFW